MDISQIEEKLTELLNGQPDLFLVDLSFKALGDKSRLQVLLDGDSGVDIDRCADISRSLNTYIDENDLVKSAFSLEVSSAGIDRPLQLLRQYKKNIGRRLGVLLPDSKKIEGELLEADAEAFEINVEQGKSKREKMRLKYSDVKQTKVLVSFK